MPSQAACADQNDAPAPDASRPERRTAPRFAFKAPVEILTAGSRETGTVWDMSASGARIEKPSWKPVEGQPVTLRLAFLPGSLPILLTGTIVRKTKLGGFGIRFAKLNPRTRQILLRILPKVSNERVDSQEQQTTYSGQMLLSIGPEIQQACIQAAESAGVPLDAWLGKQLEKTAAEEIKRARAAAARNHDPSTCADCRRKRQAGTAGAG